MEMFMRVFLVLAGLTFVAMIMKAPKNFSTAINGLAQGSSTTFGTFLDAVPSNS